MDGDKTITDKDRGILRETAKMQMELANKPQMETLKAKWRRHNDLQNREPLVTVEYGCFYNEVIPPLLKCESQAARNIEARLYGNFVSHWLFDDDTVVPDFYPVYHYAWFSPFDIEVKVTHAENSWGHHFEEAIVDLEKDFYKLKKSSYGVNKTDSKQVGFLEDIFGGVLPVKLIGRALYAGPTMDIVHIMSLENMFTFMYDYPNLYHRMMEMLTDDYIAYFKLLEDEKALLPTVGHENVAQGTYAYTNDLPKNPDKIIKTTDLWGYLDSQESTGLSPEMFHEFIFPYYQKIASMYGLLSYGCCEAADAFWEKSLSKFDNLRKLSISAYTNEDMMGEILRDRKVVYHRKLSYHYLGTPDPIDEDGLRKYIRKTLTAATGCAIEFTQRDCLKIYDTYKKVRRYVELIKQEINKI